MSLQDLISGTGQWVQQDTPTGYRGYWKKTGPNLLERVKDYLGGIFNNKMITSLPDNYQPNTSTATPTSTPSPTPTPAQYGNAPQDVTSILNSVWGNNISDPMSVLSHPMGMTNIPGEQNRGVNLNPNRGENPNFKTVLDIKNADGSTDRGLFRINSNTFADFQKRKGKMLKGYGINSFDDMNDPYKNALMAKLIQEEQGWKGWYAAPQNLRGGD